MGRISDEAKPVDDRPGWRNKVDDMLDDLDDADRAVVLGWLTGPTGARVISADLADYDIVVSAASVDRWRLARSRGRGVAWVA